MEMCYAGAIAMPSSYVVMNEEEMTYTEGGKKILVAHVSAHMCSEWAAKACIMSGLTGAVGGAVTIVGAVAAVLTCGASGAVAAICGGILTVCAGVFAAVSGYLWYCSLYSGLDIYYNPTAWINKVTVKCRK